MIKNPKSTGCKTALHGGMTLEHWDIEDDKFYANEGKGIMTRNLWASIPNLLMGFAVWLMWSVTAKRIQMAHDKQQSSSSEVRSPPFPAPSSLGCGPVETIDHCAKEKV